MSDESPGLFPESQPQRAPKKVIPCERCAKRCRAGSGRADSRPFRKAQRGMCLECCVAGLLQRPTDGDEVLPTALAMAMKNGFTPEHLRLPHIQEAFARLMQAGNSEARFEEIDWDEVIANWNLPFPGSGRGRKGK